MGCFNSSQSMVDNANYPVAPLNTHTIPYKTIEVPFNNIASMGCKYYYSIQENKPYLIALTKSNFKYELQKYDIMKKECSQFAITVHIQLSIDVVYLFIIYIYGKFSIYFYIS